MTFKQVKKLMAETLVMRLLDFSKIFEVICDTLGLAIGDMLSQENHLVAYFSEKLNEAGQRYATYDKKFYAIV